DLSSPALLLVAELPEGTSGDLRDVRGKVVASDHDPLTPDGEPAGPLARRKIGVVDGQPTRSRDLGREVERIARVFLDRQGEIVHLKGDRLVRDRDEKPLGVERPRLSSVSREPVATIRPGERADERTELLGERQLGKADLI